MAMQIKERSVTATEKGHNGGGRERGIDEVTTRASFGDGALRVALDRVT
jgi:hypothetical protein